MNTAMLQHDSPKIRTGLRRSKPNGSARALHTPLTAADRKMFSSLRIDPQLTQQAGVSRLDTAQAQHLGFSFTPDADLSGVFFPYCDGSGVIQNGRIRRDYPELNDNGEPENKYISMPSGRLRLLYRPPNSATLLRAATEILLVEAEKSVLAITAAARRAGRKIAVLGLGGCWGWREKKDVSVPLADLEVLRGRTVGVLLDANVASNPHVRQAERELCAHLGTQLGADVRCYRLPVEPRVNGPDDYLGEHNDRDFWRLLENPVEPWLADVGESYESYSSAKAPEFVIDGFLQSQGFTMIAGLSGHGKTWVLMSMVQSLLNGSKLFGYFKVVEQSRRVVYLTPEISLGSFKTRADKFQLEPHLKSGRLLVRTLSAYPFLDLSDPNLLLSVRGADVFLDTAIRFIKGDESSSSDNDRGLAADVFRLLQAGARTVTAAHHAPKGFEKATTMSLETVLRGSGDIGASLSTAWGVRRVDVKQTLLYIENVKPRDFEPCDAFTVKGRPFIDDSKGLQIFHKPGEAGPLSAYLEKPNGAGRKKDPIKEERTKQLIQWAKDKRSSDEMLQLAQEKDWNIKPSTLRKEINQARQNAKF